MNKYLKISSPRSQLALFLVLTGGAWILAIIVSSIVLIARQGIPAAGHASDILSDPRYTGLLKFLQAISTVIIFGLPAYLFARFTYRSRNLYFLGFRKAEKNSFYLLAVAILLVSFPMEGWLGELNQGIPLPGWMLRMENDASEQISVFLRGASPLDILLNVFIIAALPAVCEEACFRGVLQRILIRSFKNPWAGIIVTAAFFSAFHMQFQGFLPRMFLGILLGAVYWYSGSLWASILAHFVTNAVQVVAASFYPKMITENPSVPVYAALLSMVIVVGLLSVMRRQSKVTYAGVYGLENIQDHEEFL
jgi:CAAX protease family protein